MSLLLLAQSIEYKHVNERVQILEGRISKSKTTYGDCISRLMGEYSTSVGRERISRCEEYIGSRERTDVQTMRIHLNLLRVVRDHLKYRENEDLLVECERDIQLLEEYIKLC